MKQKYLLGAIVAIQSTMLASAGLASTLTTDETENYLAIILDGDDEREFGSGSGSSSEGDVLQSA